VLAPHLVLPQPNRDVSLPQIALRVRSAGQVTGLPVLAAVAVLANGSKRLVALEVCGAKSGAAWEGFVEGSPRAGSRCHACASSTGTLACMGRSR